MYEYFIKICNKNNLKSDQEEFRELISLRKKSYDDLLDSNYRIKTGSFYTKDDISDFMIKKAIIDYYKINYKISNNIDEIVDFKINDDNKNEAVIFLNNIVNLKVIDLASGSGNLILSFILFIKKLKESIYKYDSNIKLPLIDLSNFFCVDINATSLKVLIIRVLNNFNLKELKNYNINLINKDSLIGDVKFNIKFDIVLGNPPYIGEKGNKEIFDKIKITDFGKKYYESKMDYFYFFIYKGSEILKENGILLYISTAYFITADGAKKFRKFIENNLNFISICDFSSETLFKSAKGQHNLIYSLTYSDYRNVVIGKYEYKKTIECKKSFYIDKSKLYSNFGNILILNDAKNYELISKIYENSNDFLYNYVDFKQGIVSGADKVSSRMYKNGLSSKFFLNEGIFVLKAEEIQEKKLERKLIKKFYKNSDIKHYMYSSDTDKYIIYIKDEILNFEEKYPNIYKHLLDFKIILEKRREVVSGKIPWYALQWPRNEEIFLSNKIVNPQRALKNYFSFSDKEFYASADVYFLKIKKCFIQDIIREKYTEIDEYYYLLGLLNSKLYYYLLYNIGKKKGEMLELYSTPLLLLPFINNDIEFFNNIVEKVKKIQEMGWNSQIAEEIDRLIFKKYGIDEKEINKTI